VLAVILPWVWVRALGSDILSRVLRPLPAGWQAKYGQISIFASLLIFLALFHHRGSLFQRFSRG
jgi:hypothetical protein